MAAVTAGAAMGAPVGAKVVCSPGRLVLDLDACAPAGAPAGALAGALLTLVALPLLRQGTRRGEHAAHRPAATTTTAARLVWLVIAAALGRWLAEAVLNPQMELEGVVWLALLPVLLVAAAGLAVVARGLVRRRGWARWAAVVAFSLGGVTALAGLADWAVAVVRSQAHGWEFPAGRVAVDLATPALFLAVSAGVVVLLLRPATRRDFQASRQVPGTRTAGS